MKKIILFLLILLNFSFVSDKPAYLIYNNKGELKSYKNIIEKCQNADVIFFGELHNNPICHWLELEITKDLFNIKNGNIIIGAEMFETDNQLIIDEYLSDKIKQRNFESEAKLWNNYKTDYKPILEFAKENNIKFIATNIPRRYAAMVNHGGFESLETLSDDAKKLFPPLPIKFDENLDAYKNLNEGFSDKMSQKSVSNIAKAQAVKDATMAYFINKNIDKKSTFIHYNGSYHSDNYSSILWYLNNLNPKLKIVTITCKEQDDITSIEKENEGTADFIITIPSSITKTY